MIKALFLFVALVDVLFSGWNYYQGNVPVSNHYLISAILFWLFAKDHK